MNNDVPVTEHSQRQPEGRSEKSVTHDTLAEKENLGD